MLTFDQGSITMGAIIIKADNKSGKLLKVFAKKLGASAMSLDGEKYGDFVWVQRWIRIEPASSFQENL